MLRHDSKKQPDEKKDETACETMGLSYDNLCNTVRQGFTSAYQESAKIGMTFFSRLPSSGEFMQASRDFFDIMHRGTTDEEEFESDNTNTMRP